MLLKHITERKTNCAGTNRPFDHMFLLFLFVDVHDRTDVDRVVLCVSVL